MSIYYRTEKTIPTCSLISNVPVSYCGLAWHFKLLMDPNLIFWLLKKIVIF